MQAWEDIRDLRFHRRQYVPPFLSQRTLRFVHVISVRFGAGMETSLDYIANVSEAALGCIDIKFSEKEVILCYFHIYFKI